MYNTAYFCVPIIFIIYIYINVKFFIVEFWKLDSCLNCQKMNMIVFTLVFCQKRGYNMNEVNIGGHDNGC